MTKKLLKISKYKPSILQGKFEFSVGAPVSLSLEHPQERFLLHIFSVVLVALVGLYLYFVVSSIMNTMVRGEALAEIAGIQSSIGSLESRYLALTEGVTPEDGKALGLTPVKGTQYVYRPASVSVPTLARNAN